VIVLTYNDHFSLDSARLRLLLFACLLREVGSPIARLSGSKGVAKNGGILMKINFAWSKSIACMALGLLAAVCASGQNSRGTILGHVQDSSGAAMAHVQVTAKNANTGVTNNFTTNNAGDYVFVDMVPGTYQVSVEASGFKSEMSNGLVLEVDQTLRQDFTLEVGQIKEEMTVTADAQMVQTDNTTTGNVLDQKTIEELPSNGRDFTNLLNLSAGATNLSGGTQTTGFVNHGLSNFTEVSLNGARPDSISYMVDGVSDNDAFFAGIANVPSEFAVQEVKIQTGLYSAEYGQGSGQVNVAIKSGTNQWHGQAYDFIQNDAFQPDNPLTKYDNSTAPAGSTPLPLKLPFKQNQFGGTLGGPVTIPLLYNGHNKSFWFFAYDGGRRSFLSNVQSAPVQVPTAQERTGNFSDWPYQLYDPTTEVCNPTCNPATRKAYTNNQIPSSEINAMGQKLANIYPLPNINCTLPCNNYLALVHKSIDTDNETMRVDQNVGQKDRVYFTGHIRHDYEPNPSPLPYTGSLSFTNSQLFGVNWEHTFGSQTINEARFAYNHQFFSQNADTAYGPNISAQLGFSNVPTIPALYAIPQISLQDGYTGLGAGSSGVATSTKHTSFQWVDNLKLIRGKHTFTVGADIRRLREFEQDNYLGTGNLSFNGEYTATNPSGAGSVGPGLGNAVADLLLSDESGISGPAPLGVDYLHTYGTNWNFFFQDDFRVTPKLTLNLGLRYELPPNYHTADNSGWTLDPTNGGGFIWASKSFVQNTETLAASQGLTIFQPWLRCCVGNTLVPIDKRDFAPRIGMAWRPFATDKFVLRAGYGIFYDTYMRYYDQIQNYDTDVLQTIGPAGYPAALGTEPASPIPTLNHLWSPPVTGAAIFSPSQPWNSPGFPSNILNQVEYPWNHNPYNQQWTLDTQYALRENLLLEVGYVGSHGLRDPIYDPINSAAPPRVPSDNCNFLFDASQATGTSAACATDPNFQPVDTRVPYPNLPSNVYANANVSNSTYNALQTQLRQRFRHGLNYQVFYTYSKALDDSSAVNNVSGLQSIVQNPQAISAEYGPASFDQRHRLTANGSWDLPVGKGQPWSAGWANWIVGGWKMSGIYTLTSGRTFSVYGYTGPGYDELGTPWTCCGLLRYRANVTGDPMGGFSQSQTEWFNTSAFSVAPQGTFGDSEKGLLRGPYFEDLDFSFAKYFPITERQRLQYRLEIFNVGSNWHSNSQSGRVPDNNFTDPNFGSLVGLNPSCGSGGCALPNNQWSRLNLWTPRTLQMSLVYSF
jgi:hypothetical protein